MTDGMELFWLGRLRDDIGRAHALQFLGRKLPGGNGVVNIRSVAAGYRLLLNFEEGHVGPDIQEVARHLPGVGHDAADIRFSEEHKDEKIENGSRADEAPGAGRSEDGSDLVQRASLLRIGVEYNAAETGRRTFHNVPVTICHPELVEGTARMPCCFPERLN
jgi:hypothetical protein